MPSPPKTDKRRPSRSSPGYRRARPFMLGLAAARLVAGVAALPLAPFLYEEHFLVLVLLRPTKEVLLAGGFLARQSHVGLLELIAAAIPLSILGVWIFFALGRGYAAEIKRSNLPWVAQKLLPVEKIHSLQEVLRKKGARIVFMGRVAVFPSALLGAAAGSSEVKSDEFLPADAAGAAASLVEVIGAGYLLGAAYKEAGLWITVAGVAGLLVIMFALGRHMRQA